MAALVKMSTNEPRAIKTRVVISSIHKPRPLPTTRSAEAIAVRSKTIGHSLLQNRLPVLLTRWKRGAISARAIRSMPSRNNSPLARHQ